ncbi:hypothetical protein T05_6608, partial [Trichinella murrelli]
MDVKAFPSRPSVPLLIANSQRRNSILFMTAMKYHFVLDSNGLRHHQKIFAKSQPMPLSNCVSYGLMFFLVTQVHNCEDESRILISIEYRKNHGMFVFVDGVKYWYVASKWIKWITAH